MSFKLPLIKAGVLTVALSFGGAVAVTQASPLLGKKLSEVDVESLKTTVFPDGEGLPVGSGTVEQGGILYEEQCSSCHGVDGRGDMSVGVPGVAGKPLYGSDWTTGSSWPYATSVFDYVRRAMPPYNPKELSDEEVYSLTAYILYLNGLLDQNAGVDQDSLPQVYMPSRDYFGSKWERSEKDQ